MMKERVFLIKAVITFVDFESEYTEHESYSGNTEKLNKYKDRFMKLPNICGWFNVECNEYDYKNNEGKYPVFYPAMDITIDTHKTKLSFSDVHYVINFLDSLQKMFRAHDFTFSCITG